MNCNSPIECGEPSCGRTGIYMVGESVFCSAHGDKAKLAARAAAAEIDRRIGARHQWRRA
jgi:hypothetical protein